MEERRKELEEDRRSNRKRREGMRGWMRGEWEDEIREEWEDESGDEREELENENNKQ